MKKAILSTLILAISMVSPSFSAPKSNPVVPNNIPVHSLKSFASHGFFYVGGRYVDNSAQGNASGMYGQMYVEVFVPESVTQPYPLVMYHGAAQTATNWMGTPDGRKGWVHYFVEHGYVVYVVDQPARGRSGYLPGVNGELRTMSVQQLEKRFTASAGFKQPADWPQAQEQTQWPGDGDKKGTRGDAVFDAFYASQVAYLKDNVETQTLVKEASTELLKKIGPAILVTHSQAGPFGWIIADANPKLVRGIVALEPSGPPFHEAVFGADKTRSWGISNIPLTYSPPVNDALELQIEQHSPQKVGEVAGWLQKAPARQLPNLKGIPIVILSGEASYHAPYDVWTSRYLTQAGVENTYVPLADYGIKGNGHMLMIEKNSLDIAKFVDEWLRKSVR